MYNLIEVYDVVDRSLSHLYPNDKASGWDLGELWVSSFDSIK